MEGGDLDNRLPPRWLFAFEGVLARVPPEHMAEWKLAMRLRRYKRAARLFEVEPHAMKVIWDLTWRRDYRFDVITFLGQPFAEALEVELGRWSIPFSNCWAVTPESLARRLAFMPDVHTVVHADPTNRLAYGNRGLLVTDPGAMNLFG